MARAQKVRFTDSVQAGKKVSKPQPTVYTRRSTRSMGLADADLVSLDARGQAKSASANKRTKTTTSKAPKDTKAVKKTGKGAQTPRDDFLTMHRKLLEIPITPQNREAMKRIIGYRRQIRDLSRIIRSDYAEIVSQQKH